MRNAASAPSWRDVHRSVWVLGFVSMLMDISSEMIHALLPLFLVTVIGASPLAVGVIEGVAEATAAAVKVFSGALSDRLGKRKLLAALGYGLAAVTKPLFPLACSATEVFAARLIDRIGKGIRGAPRDALVADVTAPEIRGVAYGLRQALDTVGAFSGPLIAVALMALYAGDIRSVLWWAVVPAVLSVMLIVLGVREPDGIVTSKTRGWPIHRADLARLTGGYWTVCAIGMVFTFARFSEAFLILKADAVGLRTALIPLVLVVMNVVYSVVATPAGALSDRIGRPKVLLASLGALIVADLVLASASSVWAVFAGAGLWGLHMGLSQGLLSALVADTAPADLRGTAFGLFNLLTGAALLLASIVAGALWNAMGPAAPFLAGAGFAAIAGAMLAARLWNAPSGGAA